jgi:prepilin-type N-terminal cleavage/methylation domain-containing protein
MPNQSYLNMRVRATSIIQRGFSLIEMVVVLSIIAVLAGLIANQFNGESAKAAKILRDVETLKRAVLRFKMDTGSYPCHIETLMGRTPPGYVQTGAACIKNPGSNWNGPYLDEMFKTEIGTPGYIGQLVLGGETLPGRTHPAVAGYRHIFFISIVDLPIGVAREYMKACTGNPKIGYATTAMTDNLSNSKCHVENYSANGHVGLSGTRNALYFVGLQR